MRRVRLLFLALSLLTSVSAVGMFRAADLVVVPVGAALPGLNDSVWRTDIEIQNVDSVAIDVMIVLLPSGRASNVAWYRTMSNHLGGRESDGFTKLDAKLKDIPAGRAVVLEDVVKTHWGEDIKGALLVFSYEAGTYKTTTPVGGVPKLAVVRSRTYAVGETAESEPTTYGQAIPGLPWYYYVDPSQESKGLNQVVFSGIREDERYRTSVGLLNISDYTTAIYVTLSLVAEDGTVIREVVKYFSPLEHEQFDQAAISLFGLSADSVVVNATITAKLSLWTSPAADPAPGLIVYCSRIDNVTNDPVYLEQSFTKELPWDCVFNGNCTGLSALFAPAGKVFRRPLAPPGW
jgi:hypothetical protein